MAISLKKGGRFNLSKKEPGLSKIMIGLGWEMVAGKQLDLDASAFLLTANGKIPADEYFIFYNNLKSPDGALQHMGDNRTGDAEDDDELILINLDQANPSITEILIIVTIHDESGNQNFGLLKEAYIRLFDVETKREVLRYDLDSEHPNDTDMEFGKLVKSNGDWNFVASGIGSQNGLQGYVDKYA